MITRLSNIFNVRLIWIFPLGLIAAPPREIPPDLYDEYTFGNTISVHEWYLDNSYPPEEPLVFEIDQVEHLISQAKARTQLYYGATDRYLYAILDRYASSIEGKKIGIIGSTTPWYESIILAYGGHPVTIDYNKIISKDPRLEVMTVEEYQKKPKKFDAILSVSSIEHDGLGRYGDLINPYGDLQMMDQIKTMLNEGGLLFLSIPVGQDAIYWNAHRVYGKIRLPLLFETWEMIDSEGFAESDLTISSEGGHQPVFVLRPKADKVSHLPKN